MSQGGVLTDGGSAAPDIEFITGDSGGPVGPSGGNINLLAVDTNSVIGSPGTHTLTITPTTRGYPITPYVSGPLSPAGEKISGYSSVTAMVAATQGQFGPFFFAMQGGWYVENVNFSNTPNPNNVHCWGVVVASKSNIQGTCLQGIQTLQTNGLFFFENIQFINGNSSNNCFQGDGLAGGSSVLYFKNCNFELHNGYALFLPNWSGTLVVDSCGLLGVSTVDGFINNTGGGLDVTIKDSILGSSTTNTATFQGGAIKLINTTFNCPINFLTGCVVTATNCIFYGGITLSNNSTANFYNCTFETGSSAAITMSSSGSVFVDNPIINSSNNPAIDGSGTGVLTLANPLFLNNSSVSSSLTLSGIPGFYNYTSISAPSSPYTVLGTDNYISADVTAGAVTVRIPNSPTKGRIFTVKDKIGSAAVSNITVTTVGGAVLIDGAASYTINQNYKAISLLFNGTSYEVF